MFFVYFLRKKKKKLLSLSLHLNWWFTPSSWLWDEAASASKEDHTEEATLTSTVENEDIKSWIPTYVGREMKQLVWFFRFSVLLGLISRLRLGVMRQKRRWQMKAFKRMKRAKPCQQWICRACFFTTDSLHILERW